MKILEIKHFNLQIVRPQGRVKKILRSIHFSVPKKGIVIILGPSGTGKSTLLRTLAGLNDLNPDIQMSGEILYQGQNLFNAEQRPVLVEQKITHITNTVKENILSHLPHRSQIMQSEQNTVIAGLCEQYQQGWMIQHLTQPVLKLERHEQRLLSIFCAVLSSPALLMLDEPTAGLTDTAAILIHDLIRMIARNIPVLMISHHIARTKMLADHVVLIANGTVQEYNNTEDFFAHPQNEMTRQYLRTGSCAELSADELDAMELQAQIEVSPSDLQEDQSASIEKSPNISPQLNVDPRSRDGFIGVDDQDLGLIQHDPDAKSQYIGPRGFVWLIRGRLAGTPAPGVVGNTRDDLLALKAAGVTNLISLTEQMFESAEAEQFGIEITHFPITDMQAPSLMQAHQFCLDVTEKLLAQRVIAIHCKAGLGRTGTMLAVYDLWLSQGRKTAQQAIQHIRSLNGLMIQSTQQTDFLDEFAEYLGERVFNLEVSF